MAIGRLITLAPDDEWGPLPPHRASVRDRGPGPPHADRPRLRVWRALERLLLLIGVVSLGYFAYVVTESFLYQALENRELDAILASGPVPAVQVSRPRPAPGSMIGRIEIPRLGV